MLTTCLRCNIPLEPGFIADSGYAVIMQARWCPGEPQPSWFTGEIRSSQVKQGLKIDAHRCPQCGRLELVADTEP